ncbi:MAG: chemoreceptor glutamine deamidase CheD [Sphaerospermopsis sp. SIO1G2]|nr:chemoreceptor glutamine deamidase CheD [Sphaerospermopsis sp. SIO1G2]
MSSQRKTVERRNSSGLAIPKDHTVVKLFSGDCEITDKPKHVMVTILGSCISACIRDAVAKVGGMNHFLLPNTPNEIASDSMEALRYGAYAMEQLINALLKAGAKRDRLEIKVFGGGNVLASNMMIGDRNVHFIREYLRNEGLRIVSEDLGDKYPRRIHYYPDTGKVMMRKLHRKEDMKVVEEERNFAASLRNKPIEGGVDLF